MASAHMDVFQISDRVLMRPPAGHSHLYCRRDDDGDDEDPQFDDSEAGVSNVHHQPHAPGQELHQVHILHRYRRRVVRRIDVLHLIAVSTGYLKSANPMHSEVISAKHSAQQTAVIFGQRFTCFRTSSFNLPHSSQRSNTRTCSGRLCHFSSFAMADTPMKSLTPWDQDKRTTPRKLLYERPRQIYVDIVRLYEWIPRRTQEARVRVLPTRLGSPLREGHTQVGGIHSQAEAVPAD
jgi:hypothetical protein